MGFSKQEHWIGLPCPPPGDLPHPGLVLVSLASPALAGRFFYRCSTWEDQECVVGATYLINIGAEISLPQLFFPIVKEI